jgi:hypothetical protein
MGLILFMRRIPITTVPIPFIPDVQGCVFKLYWSKFYIVIKVKTFLRQRTIIQESLDRFLRKGTPDHHYTSFFEYIKDHPGENFRVEVLFESENPYMLLKHEQIWLDKSKNDIYCLNTIFEAYIPKGIQGSRRSWINRGHYLNFRMWLKRRVI